MSFRNKCGKKRKKLRKNGFDWFCWIWNETDATNETDETQINIRLINKFIENGIKKSWIDDKNIDLGYK